MSPDVQVPQRVVFVGIATLYLFAAVWVRVRYPWFHYSVALGMFSVGAALFIAANSVLFFGLFDILFAREIHTGLFLLGLVSGLLLVALASALWSVRVQARLVERYRAGR